MCFIIFPFHQGNVVKAIGYTRVSTSEQGKSGLGIEAQKADIQLFCEKNGIDLLDIVQEVTSAKGDYRNRPTLYTLISKCKKEKCSLIVSKLDRLSRDVESIANLVNDRSIRFIVVQLGLEADNFQIHLFASLAQKERDWISQRTKAALQAKKEKAIKEGIELKLGNRKNPKEANAKGLIIIKNNADKFAENLSDLILNYKARGFTLSEISVELNKLSIPTPRGGIWHPKSVSNLIKRLQKS
ncbi:MAG: hypothetical protein RLZZ66_659 [Pseudomonadota bacterium]